MGGVGSGEHGQFQGLGTCLGKSWPGTELGETGTTCSAEKGKEGAVRAKAECQDSSEAWNWNLHSLIQQVFTEHLLWANASLSSGEPDVMHLVPALRLRSLREVSTVKDDGLGIRLGRGGGG